MKPPWVSSKISVVAASGRNAGSLQTSATAFVSPPAHSDLCFRLNPEKLIKARQIKKLNCIP
jgi:hypothetical protein